MIYKQNLILGCLLVFLLTLSSCASMNNVGDYMAARSAESYGDQFYAQKDYSNAFTEYQKAANYNGKYGQYMVATMYLEGRGTKKNYKKFVEWMSKSAANGYTSANYLMGQDKLASDPGKAVQNFMKAADDEHGGSMYALGLLYATGNGVEKNDKEALRWFRMAQAQGFPVSQKLLDEKTIQNYITKEQKKVSYAPKVKSKKKQIVYDIQKELQRLGYNPGGVDGLFGANTKTAIQKFQKDHKMVSNGKVSETLLIILRSK